MYIYSISCTQTHTTSSSLPIFRIAINLSIHLSDVFLNIFFQTPSTTPKRKKEGIIPCMKYNHSLYMPVTSVHDITTYLWLTSQFSNREVVNVTSFPMVGLIGPAKCTPRLRLAQSPRRTSWPESMAKERNSKIQVDTGFPMNFFTSQNTDGMVEWMDSFWDTASSSSPSGDQKYPCFFFEGSIGWMDKIGRSLTWWTHVYIWIYPNMNEYENLQYTVANSNVWSFPSVCTAFWWRSLHFWNVMTHQVDISSHMHFWGNRQTKTCLRWSLNPFCSVQLQKGEWYGCTPNV